MQKAKPKIKKSRNLQIYELYITTPLSVSQIANKYRISPQRVSNILREVQNSDYGSKLMPSYPVEYRNNYTILALQIVLKGGSDLAFALFDEVLAWDTAHKNVSGQLEIIGYKLDLYMLFSSRTKQKTKKLLYISEAISLQQQKLVILKLSNLSWDYAFESVELAQLLLKQSDLVEEGFAKPILVKALELIDTALPNYPGTEAGKSKPIKLRADILLRMGLLDAAYEELLTAQQKLIEGYDVSLHTETEGEQKLAEWNAELQLGFSNYYKQAGKAILA